MTTFEARPPRWGFIGVVLFALAPLLQLGLRLREGSATGAAVAGAWLLLAAVLAFGMARWRAVVTRDEVRLEGPLVDRTVRWTDIERVAIGGGPLPNLGGATFIPRTGKKVTVPGVWRTTERDATVMDLAARAARDVGVDVEQRSGAGVRRALLLVGLLVAGVVLGVALGGVILS
jgi:hypothetical protein